MRLQRTRGPARLAPFPVHEGLVERLLGAHASPDAPRDEVLAHALGCCAGYAYADLDTVVTIASRVGLEECAGVRLTQVAPSAGDWLTGRLGGGFHGDAYFRSPVIGES